MEHPIERSLHHICTLRSPLPDSARLNTGLQHHRLPLCTWPAKHLHDLDWLCAAPTDTGTIPTTCTLESRPIRDLH